MDTDMITSGTLFDLEPAPVPVHVGQSPNVERSVETLVAGRITAYLEQEQKTFNSGVMVDMLDAFERAIKRQLMSTRDTRKGYESCTVYSGKCARKSRLQYDGVAGEPIQARSILKFVLGDLVELAVIGIAQLAGVDIRDNNKDLYIVGRDGVHVPVHPDGMVRDESGTPWNLEIKSCDSRTFDKWLEQGGPGDEWGYVTQTAVEYAAWCESGIQPQGTVFIAVSTGSRQGSIAEWIIPFDEQLLDQWHDKRALARGLDVPPIPFALEPELDYKPGKAIDAEMMASGAVPRVNAKGAVYGWDIPSGRTILPTVCSYCSFKQHCYKDAVMEVKNGRPVWVKPNS